MELPKNPRKILCGLCAVLLFTFPSMNNAAGQTAESLSQVKKVFVDSFGTEEGAKELRDAIVKALGKHRDIQIVATPSEADSIIKGSGKIWVTGSMNVGPHSGILQKTYSGYLQGQLMGKGNNTLWSYRVTPSKFPWNGIVWDLASHLVNNLLAALQQHRNVMVPNRQQALGSR
jgi:hypothetical protein